MNAFKCLQGGYISATSSPTSHKPSYILSYGSQATEQLRAIEAHNGSGKQASITAAEMTVWTTAFEVYKYLAAHLCWLVCDVRTVLQLVTHA